MSQREQFQQMLEGPAPVLALAPMQDITDLPFWDVMMRYGGADVYWTEYFRVHPTSTLVRGIRQSIVQNPTGKPVIAQMIGNDIPSLVRTAKELQRLPIAGVDLNLGCPAPIVYRKCAGGGLLREPRKIGAILSALRDAIEIKFTVKTRVGFDSADEFGGLLDVFGRHRIDLLTVHGRVVTQMYRGDVRYDLIAKAEADLPFPVIANGNICSAESAAAVLAATRAKGLMMGRGAIRNPWLFRQIREHLHGEQVFVPSGRDVLGYVRDLYNSVRPPQVREKAHVQKMKKYMNHLGLGVDSEGRFLHEIRRAQTEAEFFRVCEDHLNHGSPMLLQPAAG